MSKKIYTVSMILVLLIAGGAAAFGISRHVQKCGGLLGGWLRAVIPKTGRTDRLFPNRCILKAGTRYKENYSGNISFKDM